MTNTLGNIIADFSTTLNLKVAFWATTATLDSATDDDGVSLPTWTYFFTIDGNNAAKEYIKCTLTGTALTAIQNVSRQGTLTTGIARATGHRKGAVVKMTDFAIIKKILDLLDGTTSFNASTPLGYDGTASITTLNQFATKAYVDGIAIAGSPDSTTTTKGIGRVSVDPASPTIPIFVGDNDPRVPTQWENDASVGAGGTVGSSNLYETQYDTSNASTKTATTIAFVSASKTITDSGNGFVTAGFKQGTQITITGSASNNGTFTIVSVAAGSIVVVEALVNESAGATVVITTVTANKLLRLDANSKIPPLSGENLTNLVGKKTIPLGEAFTGATTPQPAVIINDCQLRYTDGIVNVGYSTYSANTNVREIALRIIPRTNVTSTSIRTLINKNGTPANATIEIQTNSGSVPSGTPITNGTSNAVVAATIWGNISHLTFTFASAFTMTAGTTYWVVLKIASLSDTNNLTILKLANASKYASFEGAQKDGSNVWQTASVLPYFEIIPTTSGSFSLWRSDGNAVEPYPIFDGFVTTTGNAGDSGTVITSGTVPGFTALSPWADYYVSNTVGTITLNVNEWMRVWTAISTTQISIPTQSISPRFSRSTSSATFIYQAQEDGILLCVWYGTATGMSIYASNSTTDASVPSSGGTTVYSYAYTAGGTASLTVSIPLQKGQFYQFSSASGTIYWIPMRNY